MIYIWIVFLGACSYGVLSTIVKLAYDANYDLGEIAGSQNLMGWLLIAVIAVIFSSEKGSVKQWISLALVGWTSGLTLILYYSALKTIPASIAIVLLFQFTWIGVLLEAIVDKKMPNKKKLFSVIFLFIGTLLAAGIYETDSIVLTTSGVIFGLLSAVTYTLFIYFSGKVELGISTLSRSFMISTGGLILIFVWYPPYFLWNGTLTSGLWLYGLLLAVFGIVIPTLCLAKGLPHVGPGLGSILGAAELPVAVILSAVILKEEVSVLQWLGLFIILAGIVLPYVRKKRLKTH